MEGSVKVLGPLGHDIDLWIGYGDDWVLEPRRVVVDGPGVWTSVVSRWVREGGMGAVRVRVTPEGGMPIEQFCSVSGKLWHTRYDQATGVWLPRELVVEVVEEVSVGVKEFHAFGRCITMIRSRCATTPFFHFASRGQATEWPWWEVRVGRIDVMVSRIRPRGGAR